MRIFSFRPETPFLGKFGPKNQNCQFKLKFGTQTSSNMQNLMVMFTLSVFDQKYSFWVNSTALKNLYFSFIHSYLNYGNIVWGSASRTKLKKLASKLKKALRMVNNEFTDIREINQWLKN